MADARETGLDTEVSVGGQTVAYTTASYDLVYETAASDMNDRPAPYTAVYARYMEGSLEWDGSQVEAVNVFLNAEGDQVDDITITMTDGEKQVVGEEITITNMNREMPADDKTNSTIDFKADLFRIENL